MSQNQVVLTPGEGEKGILDKRFIRSVFDAKTRQVRYEQPIDYICVYDLECNCSKEKSDIAFNEIIELPVVVIDVKAQKVKSIFHTYVTLTIEKNLNEFCTELTGITNEQVLAPGTPTIQNALDQLHEFLEKEGIFGHEFIFMSCGDFDGSQLKRESTEKNFKLKSYLKRWINLKKVFPTQLQLDSNKDLCMISKQWNKITQEKDQKPNCTGMTDMLEKLGLPLEGRHHSGIDDAKNLANVVLTLLSRGFVFNQSMIRQGKD